MFNFFTRMFNFSVHNTPRIAPQCAPEVVDASRQGWTDRKGKTCHASTINLYDVMKYIVFPATEEWQCSYVELVAPEGTTAQKPKYFVSHWWASQKVPSETC